ncbi:NADPH-dependent aldehyde reductase Ahr [Mariniblastus fucicola]|uniref:alcohol dehydrogenase (NADP(+)) n=1 Tax=Mariniblastus fucicola TaxID=980251 RepID=A0A5B9PRS3_9BACT|nr:NAD(P)-dependent alcohol dehydrogenase [Mariniblastus fucicola]QEG24953.1 Aldehyde reductase Ahr [Mariniblastus fucicola]
MSIKAYAALEQGKELEAFEYEAGDLRYDEVEIKVEYCGICHSDLSMLKNDWGMTQYPLVPGHEVVGTVSEVGEHVTHLKVGQRVGLGWKCRSCMTCDQCLSGKHNRCQGVDMGHADTIVGRHGGFADKVRCQSAWAIPLPESVAAASAGPLLCGGITVFNPFLLNEVKPTHRVGVVGIGGLGHMAVTFANKWGCEVTAFSTSPDKESEVRKLGAHHFINSKDESALENAANSFDMLLVTVNVSLNWDAHVKMLRPGGKLHIVGAVPSVEAEWFPFIMGAKSIGGSPIGSPVSQREMVEFCGRHEIAPTVEEFPMSQVNEAMDKLENGSPHFRLVLKNDF